MEKFKKPGAAERFKQLGHLLKNTVTVIGRDRDIIRPWLRTAIYAVVMISLFFGGIAAITLGAGGAGTLLLLVAIFLFIYKYFYYTRQQMGQSWLVAEAVRGRDAVPGDGRRRVRELKSQARGLGWASLAFAFLSARSEGDEQGGGLGNMLVRLFLAALTEVWDLAKHFLIPTVVVDKTDLRDGLERLKSLKNSVPETLVGVFGIDIAGGAVGAIAAPVYLLLIAAAVALGFMLGDPTGSFYVGDARTVLGDQAPAWLGRGALHFSWLPLLIALWLGKLISAVFALMVDSFKVIYFTLFYLRTAHPEDIEPELAKELDAYLKIESSE